MLWHFSQTSLPGSAGLPQISQLLILPVPPHPWHFSRVCSLPDPLHFGQNPLSSPFRSFSDMPIRFMLFTFPEPLQVGQVCSPFTTYPLPWHD